MQKKTMIRIVVAGVLGVAVAAALVWTGSRDAVDDSLSYEELLALTGDSQVIEAVQVETEASSVEEDSALSSSLEELEADASSVPEEPDSTVSEEENTDSETRDAVSSENVKSEAVASSESASSSSAVSGAAHSTAASTTSERTTASSGSSQPSSSTAHSASTASSASSSKEKTCDEQLADCVRQIEALQTRSEQNLYSIIYDAFDEYMSHPESERNLMLKISVVLSKSGELTEAQNKCDKEFKAIITEMRKILKENGRDETLADEAEKTYKQKKNAMIKELTDQAYSGGDGSGKSGSWLAEKAGKLS